MPAEEESEGERDKYGVVPNVPSGVDWDDFLVRMGWTDEAVLNRQRASWVQARWKVFEFETVTGLLLPTSMF